MKKKMKLEERERESEKVEGKRAMQLRCVGDLQFRSEVPNGPKKVVVAAREDERKFALVRVGWEIW